MQLLLSGTVSLHCVQIRLLAGSLLLGAVEASRLGSAYDAATACSNRDLLDGGGPLLRDDLVLSLRLVAALETHLAVILLVGQILIYQI